MRAGEFDHGKQIGIWRTLDRGGRLVAESDPRIPSPSVLRRVDRGEHECRSVDDKQDRDDHSRAAISLQPQHDSDKANHRAANEM